MSEKTILEEYRYVARKMQLRYPNPVMGYMLLLIYGTEYMFDARMLAMKQFEEACK